jgi:signal transduction histidine kinase
MRAGIAENSDMHNDYAMARQSLQAKPFSSTPVLLEGRLLTVARGTWLLVATLSVGLFLAGVPFHYRQLLDVCVGNECSWTQLSPPEMLALQNTAFSPTLYATYSITLTTAWALAYATIALIIFWRRSNEWMALLAALWLVTFGTMAETPQALAASQPLLRPLVQILGEFGWAFMLPLFLFTFPDGRFISRWTRLLFIIYMVVGAIGTAIEHFIPHLVGNQTGEQVAWFGMMFTGIGTQVYRYRRLSDPTQRQQTKWVVSGLVVTALGLAVWLALLQTSLPFDQPGLPTLLGKLIEMTLVTAVFLVIALTIGFSILRYRLWDIDVVINRALIWGLLSSIVIGMYVLVVGAFGALFQARGSLLPSVIATGLIALLFEPLRQRVQRGVNRLMYGERDEPYSVLSRLGRRLEATLAAEAVLPAVVETVAHTLKLPYVAITLKEGGEFRVAASSGDPVAAPLVLPLTYRGETIGQLICGPRSGGEAFRGEEHRLLEDIASQAGVALHAVQLNADLQRSRERLVVAREEERRRIRRDLHDGLGPALASQTLKIGSARALLERDPKAADALLQQIEQDNNAALEDIRRLVYNLRPPALDELGLLRAMQQDAPRHAELEIIFDLPPGIEELSAAVEVAIYRIVQEGLANVVRHAGATSVTVSLETGADLLLIIADNGHGLPPEYHRGVGLRSMRERAEELGGTFQIDSAQGDGTSVRVTLPLREAEA